MNARSPTWTAEMGLIEEDCRPDADMQKIVFQTDLGDPYFLRITKTYTLQRKDYHIGLKVDIKTAGRQARLRISSATS